MINTVCIFVFSVLSFSCDELVTVLPSSAHSTRAGLPHAKTISLGKGGVSRHAGGAQGILGYIIQENHTGYPIVVFRCILVWEHLWKILGISWIWYTSKGKKLFQKYFYEPLGLSSFWQVRFSGSQRGDSHQQQRDFTGESCGRAWAAHPSWEPGSWGSSPLPAGVTPCPMPTAKEELLLTERKQLF